MAEYICKEDFIKILKEKSPIPFVETNVLIGAVSVFPAADVQPVKQGRWETEICDDGYGAYNLFVCSLCGSESAKRFNYCRECGARMDGEDNV